MKKAIKNVLALTLITLVAGLLLGYVYDITKKPIEDMAEKTKQEAYIKVFPGAASFAEDTGKSLEKANDVVASNGISGVDILEVLDAVDSAGNKLGIVVTAVSHEGYGGDIKISMGIDSTGCLLGVEILSISETAGLGMKADTDEFKNQFKNKTVSQFSFTKTGATQDFEIDALSGATITTKAFINGVNAGVAYANSQGGGQ